MAVLGLGPMGRAVATVLTESGMAVPPMIGGSGASILYSGSAAVFERSRSDLEKLATAEYFGADAGTAALFDFALLAGMYAMFTGFFHGTAMVRSAGVTATEFAPRAVAYVTAMAALVPAYAAVIDSGDYTDEAQRARFHKPAFDAIVRASRDAGVALDISPGPSATRAWSCGGDRATAPRRRRSTASVRRRRRSTGRCPRPGRDPDVPSPIR